MKKCGDCKKFYKRQPVKLIGENNPFNGEKGTFKQYGTGVNAKKLYVTINGKSRWFWCEEVVKDD